MNILVVQSEVVRERVERKLLDLEYCLGSYDQDEMIFERELLQRLLTAGAVNIEYVRKNLVRVYWPADLNHEAFDRAVRVVEGLMDNPRTNGAIMPHGVPTRIPVRIGPVRP